MTIEKEGRRVKISGRDERTGKMVTLRLSRPGAENVSMALRSVVKVREPDVFDFATHGDLETA
jgi:hypothetical protein